MFNSLLLFLQMKIFLLLFILIQIFQRMFGENNQICYLLCTIEIQGQCSGGIWPIEDANIGALTVSWRYNIALNTVQFLVQGKIDELVSINGYFD